MPLKSVCNLCLAMDRPMRSITGSSLQDVYKKLTNISLKTASRPVVACYLCYSQLRKCHNLMIRSAKADKVLSQVLQCGKMVNGEFMAMIKLEARKLINALEVTPVEVTSIASMDWIEVLKDDPLSPYKEEIEKECIVSVKLEDEDVVMAVLEDGEGIGEEEWTFGEDIKQEELKVAIEIESNEFEDAAPAKESKHTQGDNIEAATTPALDEINLSGKLKSRIKERKIIEERKKPRTRSTVIEEALNKNSALTLHTDRTVNNGKVGKYSTSIYSNTALNDNHTNDKSDNESYSNNVDDVNEYSNYLKDIVNCDGNKCFNDEGDGNLREDIMLFEKRTESGAGNRSTKTLGGDKYFECEICDKKIIGKIETHLRTHAVEKPFMCEICARRFKNRNQLTIHLRRHNGEKPFECDICKVKFDQKDTLKVHLRTHTNEKPFKCELCQHKFRSKSGLGKHLLRHTGKKPFECTVCQRRFYVKNSLTLHIRSHTLEKPYDCNVCEKTFSYKNCLNRHLRTHSGVKSFECEQCQRRFSTNNHLKLHFRTHTGDKPFECDVCQASFARKDNLTAHLRIHTGERPFECAICRRRFNQGSSLKTHMRIHSR